MMNPAPTQLMPGERSVGSCGKYCRWGSIKEIHRRDAASAEFNAEILIHLSALCISVVNPIRCSLPRPIDTGERVVPLRPMATTTSVRLVCFDLGGVLVRIARGWDDACRRAGV